MIQTLSSKLTQRVLSSLMLAAFALGAIGSADAQTRRRTVRRPTLNRTTRAARTTPAVRSYTLRADTTIRVRLDDELSSDNARVGDRFKTTVVDPVYASGVEVIPAGSTITGRVTTVTPAARRKAGSMAVQFISVTLPNGTTRSINGSLAELGSGGDVNVDNESQVSGRSNKKRNAVFIGGGAVTGAAIGGIAGGGKGAGIGTAIGAGAGVAGALLTKGKEAEVKSGTEFGVILNQSVALPAANVR